MALRGTGSGGYSFALPAAYDDTADLSVFLWLRRGGGAAAGARIFSLINAARTRGFTVHLGGTVGGTSLASDVVVSVGSTRDTIWGTSNQGGRGRAILPGLPDTEFCALAFSVRGSAAADNTASIGAQQLHQVWWKGAAAAVTATSIGSGIPAQGGRGYLLFREPGNLSGFEGWVAEVAVWQDHRLSEAEAMLLSRGGSPLWVAADKLWLHRSFRADVAAEVGDTALSLVGSGVGVEAHTHPPLLVAGAGAAHASGGAAPVLTAGAAAEAWLHGHGGALAHGARAAALEITGAPPLALARGRHGHRAGAAALAAVEKAALNIQRGRLAVGSRAPGLLPVAGAAEVLHVPLEVRLMEAGIF